MIGQMIAGELSQTVRSDSYFDSSGESTSRHENVNNNDKKASSARGFILGSLLVYPEENVGSDVKGEDDPRSRRSKCIGDCSGAVRSV